MPYNSIIGVLYLRINLIKLSLQPLVLLRVSPLIKRVSLIITYLLECCLVKIRVPLLIHVIFEHASRDSYLRLIL
jgi:hypothetical protein